MSTFPPFTFFFIKKRLLHLICCDRGSQRHSRVLMFNCTNGRSGEAFLTTILTEAAACLQELGNTEPIGSLFDDVVFCANVTYADGGFKGGA
jgi:folylpolyglutamate synthase